MATTQYIGARYIPLFAEPIEWDKTKQYEPLTIVTHEGNSYTSRQFVPTGIEITNEEFWALTGNYNAQIEQYRKEVTAYNGRITTAQETADSAATAATAANQSADAATAAVAAEKTRAEAKESEIQSLAETNETNIAHLDKQMAATMGSELLNKITEETSRATSKESEIVAKFPVKSADIANNSITTAKIADNSITTAKIANGSVTPEKLSNATSKMLCIGDSYARMEDSSIVSWCAYLKDMLGIDTLTKYAEGGSGWVTPGIAGSSFTTLTNKAIADIADKDAYSYVVIAGGRNDSSNTSYSKMKKNALGILTSLRNAFTNARIIVVPMLWHNVRSYGRNFLTMAGAVLDAASETNCEGVNWAWTWGLGKASLYDGNIHPLSAGGKMIANYMFSAINGTYSGRTYAVNVSGFGSGDCFICGSGGTFTINVGGTYSNQNAELPDEFKCGNFGSTWGVIYAQGGSSTAILQLSNNIGIYQGGDRGNIGGTLSFPW